MKLYQNIEHPLRVYLEDEHPGEVDKLARILEERYYPPKDMQYLHAKFESDELNSLILIDEDENKPYVVKGLANIIMKEATSIGIPCTNTISIEDFNLEYPEIDPDILEGITLREYQVEGISSALAHRRGLIQVHTGGGKTEMMIGIAKYLLDTQDFHILLCVPTTNLLYQTYERALQRGISSDDIFLLGDGNQVDPNKCIGISTVASAYLKLNTDKEYMEWLAGVDCLMMDEAHHSKCRTWSTVIDSVSPTYLLGFSAEPFHRDKGHIIPDLVLRGLIGPVIHRVTSDYLIMHKYLSKPCVLAINSRYKGSIYTIVDWHIVNKSGIIGNILRNDLIVNIAEILINLKKEPLILVQQIKHGMNLGLQLSERGYNVYMMKGGRNIIKFSGGRVIDNFVDKDNQVLKDFDEGRIDALIGTSTLDEGVDIPSLSSVILAAGGKSRLKNIQRIGRGLRPKSGDNTTIVIDFRDEFNVVTKSHFKKRKMSYDELNIPVFYINDINDIERVILNFSTQYELNS